jgi:hypothetical protein
MGNDSELQAYSDIRVTVADSRVATFKVKTIQRKRNAAG